MLKTKLAGVAAVFVLLGAGAANAQTFPSSANETRFLSIPYDSMRDLSSGAIARPAPAMPSEASAHSVPVRERSTMAERISRTLGGVFPTSPNESGSM